MAPSTSTHRALSDHPHQQQGHEEHLAKLGECARWGMLSTLFSLVYGHLLVATQLPPDPRQDGWLLMKSPLPTYIVSVGYVLGVTCLAPKLMEDRRPVSGLRPVMVVYNALQVVISFWLLYEVAMAGWLTTYSYRCQTCDFSNSPEALRMLRAAYWYYVSKFADFLDTVFFLLNKKYEHISALHVVHHSLMPVNMWYGLRYQPGGHSSFMGFLNAFVHVVMYSYYLLAAMGPRVRPFLWWKKYLTTLQMVQFTAIFFHSLSLMFLECDVPSVFVRWLCGFAALFFILFTDFYIKAYRKRGKDQGEARGNGRRDYLTNMCYIGAPVGLINGMSNNVPKQMTNDIFHSSSSDIANGVTKRSPNSIPEDSSNGEPVGASLYVPQHLPPHLQENMRLRNLIRQ